MTMLRLPTKEEKIAAVEAAYEKLNDEEKKDIDKIATNFVESLRVKKGVTRVSGIGPKSMMPAIGIIAMYAIIHDIPLGIDRSKEEKYWNIPPIHTYR